MKRISEHVYRRVVMLALLGALVIIGLELRRNRRAGSAAQPFSLGTARTTTRASSRLAMHIGDIDFTAVPLRTAVRTLADRSGANLDADWPAMHWTEMTSAGPRPAGITSAQPVTLKRDNPTLREALDSICNQLEFPDGKTIAVAQNPAGILLLGLVERDGGERSVTTLPRFYDVDDLVGPAVELHPRPARDSLDYGAFHPNAARADLDALAVALQSFAGPGDIGCFGRWLIVNGYEEAHENVAAVLDRMRHPIRLTRAATQPSPGAERPRVALGQFAPIPVFSVPAVGMSPRQVLDKWEKVGAGIAVVELTPADMDDLPDVVGFELHDVTLEQIAHQIVGDPFVVVPRGEEDDRVHIRRGPSAQFRFETLPRAYDVSTILAHSLGWIDDARANVGSQENITSKENLLVRLLSSHVELREETPLRPDRQIAACWNGILLVQEAPEVHARVLRFLEHLQRTGHPYDPAPEQ